MGRCPGGRTRPPLGGAISSRRRPDEVQHHAPPGQPVRDARPAEGLLVALRRELRVSHQDGDAEQVLPPGGMGRQGLDLLDLSQPGASPPLPLDEEGHGGPRRGAAPAAPYGAGGGGRPRRRSPPGTACGGRLRGHHHRAPAQGVPSGVTRCPCSTSPWGVPVASRRAMAASRSSTATARWAGSPRRRRSTARASRPRGAGILDGEQLQVVDAEVDEGVVGAGGVLATGDDGEAEVPCCRSRLPCPDP